MYTLHLSFAVSLFLVSLGKFHLVLNHYVLLCILFYLFFNCENWFLFCFWEYEDINVKFFMSHAAFKAQREL